MPEDTFACCFPKLSLRKLFLWFSPIYDGKESLMDGNVSSESPKSFPHHPHAPSKGRTCWLAHSYHIDHFEFTVFKQAGENSCGFVI